MLASGKLPLCFLLVALTLINQVLISQAILDEEDCAPGTRMFTVDSVRFEKDKMDCKHDVCGASKYASELPTRYGQRRCCCYKSWLIKLKVDGGIELAQSEKLN